MSFVKLYHDENFSKPKTYFKKMLSKRSEKFFKSLKYIPEHPRALSRDDSENKKTKTK